LTFPRSVGTLKAGGLDHDYRRSAGCPRR
jgi:hypothetical protein